MLRLSCRDSVTSDLGSVLGPVDPACLPSYQTAHELYGGTRMLLACLSKDDLAKVRPLEWLDEFNGSLAYGLMSKSARAGAPYYLPVFCRTSGCCALILGLSQVGIEAFIMGLRLSWCPAGMQRVAL